MSDLINIIFLFFQSGKLILYGGADFIQRGVIQLLDDGDFEGVGFLGAAAGKHGNQRQYGNDNSNNLFHGNNSFIIKKMVFVWNSAEFTIVYLDF